MIDLVYGPKPSVLAANADQWTADVLQYTDNDLPVPDSVGNKYRHEDVKQGVIAETHSKCAYCESRMRHVAPGDIEHKIPKKKDPTRWFDWKNLTLACPTCNTWKGTYHSTTLPLLDPFEDSVRNELRAFGTLIVAQPGRSRAKKTIDRLRLNRVDLVAERKARVEGLRTALEEWNSESDPGLKSGMWAAIEFLVSATAEYALVLRGYLAGLEPAPPDATNS